MADREHMSKRLRFEIFKRDGFRCVYCGASPQDAPLEADHVVAVANGGTNDPENLVTSCKTCNGGKSDVPLDEHRIRVSSLNALDALEHAEQIRGYLAAQRELAEAKEALAEELRMAWEELIDQGTTTQERATLRRFLGEFAFPDLVKAMQIAASAVPVRSGYQASRAFMYFCGIVRQWRDSGVVTADLPRRTKA